MTVAACREFRRCRTYPALGHSRRLTCRRTPEGAARIVPGPPGRFLPQPCGSLRPDPGSRPRIHERHRRVTGVVSCRLHPHSPTLPRSALEARPLVDSPHRRHVDGKLLAPDKRRFKPSGVGSCKNTLHSPRSFARIAPDQFGRQGDSDPSLHVPLADCRKAGYFPSVEGRNQAIDLTARQTRQRARDRWPLCREDQPMAASAGLDRNHGKLHPYVSAIFRAGP